MNLNEPDQRGRWRASAVFMLSVVLSTFVMPAHGQSIQRDIVLVIDNSGSMRKNDPDFLTSVAVRAFINGLDGDYNVAILAFDEQAKVLKPLAPLDAGHRAELLDSLKSINYRGLLTNSPAAIESAIYELRTNGRIGAEKSIIFMTDGIVDVGPEGADNGDVEKARWMKSTLADEAADRAVRIFGIAFTDSADFELIQTLAKRTGGEYYRAYTATDIDGVFASIRDSLSNAGATPSAPSEAVNRFIAPTLEPAAPLSGEQPAISSPDSTIASTQSTDASSAQADGTTVETFVEPASETTNTGLPEVSVPQLALPSGPLPTIVLPEISIGGDTPSLPDATEPANETTIDAATDVESQATQTTQAEAQTAHKATDTAGTVETLSTDQAAPMDDSKFYLALMVGAAAIVLALAALIFVLMRRKPAAVALADALMPKAFLNDIAGSTDKQSYEVGAKPIVVGRLKGADSEAADFIVIDEFTIGRRHALIEYKEHSFWVTDQNSLNGTFVNNSRIETGVRLKHGDRIRFHKHEFEFLVLDMFETDRTMMSETVFADLSSSHAIDDDDATVVRVDEDDADSDATVVRVGDDDDDPSAEDRTITRP